MTIIDGVFLGIVQGLTEFLPISSSGHLVLFQDLLGLKEPALLLDCALHLGTLVSILAYFRSDIAGMFSETWDFSKGIINGQKGLTEINDCPRAALTLWVVIGIIPTALIGLFFRGPIEMLFGSTSLVSMALVITGFVVGVTRLVPEDYGKKKRVGLIPSLLIGTAQGLALIPGISRSGTTIVCGLLLGMDRELAARFSFLLAIPAIVGALGLQLRVGGLGNEDVHVLIIGFVTSALTGLLALKVLISVIRRGRLYYFAPYCWALGLGVLLMKIV
ncbi:MAG: undecaprenyl-diphosphate phosphatase [Deltaproteobacteria bacterium]|nr:undecaprenyl-diphosphate phosphatase [Deltaproteobacteria bacterium]MBW2136485.1 undecaprenyl-diphosphate phosphatase [Deltaproteobacteria bacterium]